MCGERCDLFRPSAFADNRSKRCCASSKEKKMFAAVCFPLDVDYTVAGVCKYMGEFKLR